MKNRRLRVSLKKVQALLMTKRRILYKIKSERVDLNNQEIKKDSEFKIKWKNLRKKNEK